jgi:hypothetical protein
MAMSLAVVVTGLPARMAVVPLAVLVPHWPVAVNPRRQSGRCVGGRVLGHRGGGWRPCTGSRGAARADAAALVWTHHLAETGSVGPAGRLRVVAGLGRGFGIGVVAAVMGVAVGSW